MRPVLCGGRQAISRAWCGAALLAPSLMGALSIAGAQTTSRWTVSAEAVLSLGGSADTTTEFLLAESAIRLRNGDIVVVNRRTSELRWFDATGRHVRTLGRRGKGPREFGRTMFVYEGAADTVIVNDADNRRFHYITAAGDFSRLDTAGRREREVWLYDRSVVERLPVSADIATLRRALVRIAAARSDSVRAVLVDQTGHLLVRGPSGGAYDVYDPAGRSLATLALPRRFEIYQVFDSLVLGRYKDVDDVEHIELRRLTRTRSSHRPPVAPAVAPAHAAYDQDVEIAAHRALLGSMRMTVLQMLTAQELHFARHQRYGRSLAEVGFSERTLPAGVTVSFVAAADRSYWLLARHASTRAVCIVAVGEGVPFGYVDVCG